MRHVARLAVLVIALGWCAAELPLAGETATNSPEPEWRRTSTGWVKVGNAGAAALTRPTAQPAGDPPLHPGVLGAFVLLAGVLSLTIFDRTGSRDDGLATKKHSFNQSNALLGRHLR